MLSKQVYIFFFFYKKNFLPKKGHKSKCLGILIDNQLCQKSMVFMPIGLLVVEIVCVLSLE